MRQIHTIGHSVQPSASSWQGRQGLGSTVTIASTMVALANEPPDHHDCDCKRFRYTYLIRCRIMPQIRCIFPGKGKRESSPTRLPALVNSLDFLKKSDDQVCGAMNNINFMNTPVGFLLRSRRMRCSVSSATVGTTSRRGRSSHPKS